MTDIITHACAKPFLLPTSSEMMDWKPVGVSAANLVIAPPKSVIVAGKVD